MDKAVDWNMFYLLYTLNYLGKIPNLTIFLKSGWNHQLDLDKWEYSRMATAAASIEKKKLSAANFAGASCIGCFF